MQDFLHQQSPWIKKIFGGLLGTEFDCLMNCILLLVLQLLTPSMIFLIARAPWLPLNFYFLFRLGLFVSCISLETDHLNTARLGVVSSLLLVCYDAVVEVDEDLNLIEHSQQSLWIELGLSEGQRLEQMLDTCTKVDKKRLLFQRRG